MRIEKDSVGTSRVWLFTLALAIALATMRVHAHVGDVVYPFTEITDEMLEMMDLTDGSIEDWETVMGEPTLNLLGFTRLKYVPRDGGGVTLALASRDPGDWDVRVWLGWHRGTGRLYFGAQVSDDRFVGGFDGEQIDRSGYDCIALYIDGDHSGGATPTFRDHQQAQYYSAVPEAPAGLHVGLGNYDGADWMDQPPYAEGGGAALGENPTVWVVEFAVTPFDLLLGDDPEASLDSLVKTLRRPECPVYHTTYSVCLVFIGQYIVARKCAESLNLSKMGFIRRSQVLLPISAPGRQSASISGSTIWIPNQRIGESSIIFSGLRILPRTDSATAFCSRRAMTRVTARSSSRSPGPGSRPLWRSPAPPPDGDDLPVIPLIWPA